MKPIVLSGSWVIKAPLQKIYEIVTDFEQAPIYFPIVAKSMKILSRQDNHLTIEAVPKTFFIPFKVLMQTELLPGAGFKSINTSALAVENESFLLEAVPAGTRIIYRNQVQLKNNILQLFGRVLIGKPALLFWKIAYIDRLASLASR